MSADLAAATTGKPSPRRGLAQSRDLCRRLQGVFACPVCDGPMAVGGEGDRSLICDHGHCFDLSAKGYVNLLLSHQRKSSTPGYTQAALRARRAVAERGFFDPVRDAVAEAIAGNLSAPTPWRLLDAGCGEGYVLSAIIARLRGPERNDTQAVGLDISKPGIEIAGRHDRGVLWCVANIAKRLPFAAGAFDVVTNLLAPMNAAEFRRVLRCGGIVVKVAPMEGHLQELREALYERPREHSFAAARDAAELATYFEIRAHRRLTCARPVDKESIRDIIMMTPLFWKAKRDRIAALEHVGLPQVTVEVDLTVGVAEPTPGAR